MLTKRCRSVLTERCTLPAATAGSLTRMATEFGGSASLGQSCGTAPSKLSASETTVMPAQGLHCAVQVEGCDRFGDAGESLGAGYDGRLTAQVAEVLNSEEAAAK
jgi:hypothetical protein